MCLFCDVLEDCLLYKTSIKLSFVIMFAQTDQLVLRRISVLFAFSCLCLCLCPAYAVSREYECSMLLHYRILNNNYYYYVFYIDTLGFVN